jgi:putative ABC transport system permease protein
MDIRESIRMASVDIRVNKMRTFLSMLGVIIGIASVIIIVAIGNGLKYKILEQFSGLGANSIYVLSSWDPKTQRSGEINLDDLELIKAVPGVADVAPQANWSAEVKSYLKSTPMEIRGVTEEYFGIAGLKLDQGRLISDLDNDFRQRVCVLKRQAALSLFSAETGKRAELPKDIVGKTVNIKGYRFTVAGVLNQEESSMGFFWSGPNTIYVPVKVLLRIAQMDSLPSVSVHVAEASKSKKIGDEIVKALKTKHDNKGEYRVLNPDDIQKEITTAMNIFTAVIGAIGALSLLVGGIGIMNIMLASVAERTREIGIRKAIGAKRRDILLQFLVEAGTISGIGGMMGILLGVALAKSISIMSNNNLPSVILPSSILISFLFSVFVGMFFGIYPSSKAANMNPIEALRYE